MEVDIANKPTGEYFVICRKAWTAYVPLVIFLVLVSILLFETAIFFDRTVTALLWSPMILWLFYKWLILRSVRLYHDDLGVWVYQGILPWSKGLRGVKWRDMDESTCITNFGSWLLNSYTIRISHRFTKESEILLTHMYKGREATQKINLLLMDKVREQKLN